MKELRDIKIDLLMGNQNPIVNLFNKITKDIKIINCNVYHDQGLEFIYFSGDQWIFHQDLNNEEFWCNYDIYWSLFETNFDLEYEDIQSITKYLVEEVLKRELNTSVTSCDCTNRTVEEVLKRELSTRGTLPLYLSIKVEEVLKRELSTSCIDNFFNNCLVEEVLKRELNTPGVLGSRMSKGVEDALKREVGTPNRHNSNKANPVEEALKNKLRKIYESR